MPKAHAFGLSLRLILVGIKSKETGEFASRFDAEVIKALPYAERVSVPEPSRLGALRNFDFRHEFHPVSSFQFEGREQKR